MVPEKYSRLFLTACFHLDVRTRLKGPVKKGDLPLMVEILKRTALRAGGGPFRPSSDPQALKAVLKTYLSRFGKKVDDEAFRDGLVRAMGGMEPSTRRAFFNELAWFVHGSDLESSGANHFLKPLYQALEIAGESYDRYIRRFDSKSGSGDSGKPRGPGRRRLALTLGFAVFLLIAGAAAFWFGREAPPDRAVPEADRLPWFSVRFQRIMAFGTRGDEPRTPGRAAMYVATGTAEVWFDLSGLALESAGEGFRAVYRRRAGEDDYAFSPLRVAVALDGGRVRETMSAELGAGNDRARITFLGFMFPSAGGFVRRAVAGEGGGMSPVCRFDGALANAAPLFGDSLGGEWLASGNLAVGTPADAGAALPDRLARSAPALVAAQTLYGIGNAEEARTAFERAVTALYAGRDKRITSFAYVEAGS